MKGNFIRINNMLLKKESDQIEKLKIIDFWLFFKMRSRDDFPLDSSWFVCLWPTQKCRKTRSDIILVTNLLSESSAVRAFLCILAHLAYLACSFSLILRRIDELMFWFKHTNTRKHFSEHSCSYARVFLSILAI